MKALLGVLPLILAAHAVAQLPPPPPYFPLPQLRAFFQLTDAQTQAILSNNNEYNQYVIQKQMRIAQVQSEIAVETVKETLDPGAIGIRYAEIEMICRDLRSQSAAYQQKNVSVLTDAQKPKLQILMDAIKLMPVISEAQGANLLSASPYVPLGFTSSSSATVTGVISGAFLGPLPGCAPTVVPTLLAGDFSSGINSASSSRPQ